MKENQTLINILLDCAIACENCANKSQIDNTKSVQLYRDCVDLCKQAIRLINHNSEITGQYLSLCEEMFKICAQECIKCNPDAAIHLQKCAEACLKTVDAVSNYRTTSRELIAA